MFFVGEKEEKVQLRTIKHIIKRKPIDFNDLILKSIDHNKKIQLEEELSFKQYPHNEDYNPIKDIQNLISNNDQYGVYLWDPYLESEDIFNTLFYSTTKNVPLKAITSKNAGKIIELKEGFEKNQNNQKDLNLIVRMQHGNYGYPFHDRFLIFPSNSIYEDPKVYSLGTSINSFGKKHHILQLVSYPELIISAFNDLWDELDDECLVWRSSASNPDYIHK